MKLDFDSNCGTKIQPKVGHSSSFAHNKSMNRQATLFRPALEYFNLLVPLVFLVLAVVDGLFWKSQATASTMSFGYLAVEAILLSNSHVFVTFVFLLCTPESRNWIGAMDKTGKTKIFLGSALAFGFFLFLYMQESWNFGNVGIFTFAVTLVANQFHALCQIRGLSLMYNKRLNIGSPETEMWEARLFKIVIYTYCFGSALWVMHMFYWAVPMKLVMAIWTVLTLAVLALIFKRSSRPKALYLSRLLLFILTPYSVFATIGIGAFHSVEYFCVADKVRLNSTMDEKGLRVFSYSVLFCVVLGILMAVARHLDILGNMTMETYPIWIKITVCTLLSLSAIHFFMDRQMFRMRNPETRRHMAPLLK